MADHNLDGVQMPQLEETSYDPSKAVKHTLDDIAVPVLEETSYTPPSQKKSDLSDVAMPALSDTYTPNQAQQPQFQQYGAPAAQAQTQQPQFQQYGVPAAQAQTQQPQFQQYGAPAAQAQTQQPQFQQYGAPAAQAQTQQPQFQQYGAPAAQAQTQQPQFQQYGAPAAQAQTQQPDNNHNLNDVQKPLLEDEPPVQQRYVPKYVDPDIENAKKAAVDRAIKSSLNSVPDSFNQEESRELYREFMKEKESDMAKKGAVTVIVLAILTILSGVLSFFFAASPLKENISSVLDTINSLYMIASFGVIVGAVLMLIKSQTTQKAASTIVTLLTILMILFGFFLIFGKTSKGTSSIFYIIPSVVNIAVCFIFGSNENIKKHYNGHEMDSYY